jgi:integrase
LTWTQYKTGVVPRIQLLKTKTSKRNNKTIFNLGEEATNILNLISIDRLNNTNSAFYFPIGDTRNDYIFPSKTYGLKIGKIKHKSPHINDPGKTWNSILKLSGVTRHMKLHSTRHTFATNFWRQTKDLKALAEALGTTEAQAMKYAKNFNESVVEGINKIKFFQDEKPLLKQVK